MSMSIQQWHERYKQQAQWTENIRSHIFSKVGIRPGSKLLDIGCGTGVLERELSSNYLINPFGLDIDKENLEYAQQIASTSCFLQSDCHHLPLQNDAFDVSFCHFVLLWLSEPQKALLELTRVTRDNGYVIAFAEPDYGGRIDFPEELSVIGTWQAEALSKQGADPFMGRKLRGLFHQAGLTEIEVGLLGGQWRDHRTDEDQDTEWKIVEADLAGNDDFIGQAGFLSEIDSNAVKTGQRILYVPTFYAWGKVSKDRYSVVG